MVIQSTLPSFNIPETDILQLLFKNVHKTPENRKLYIDAFSGNSLTLGQLKDNVLRFAASLQDKFNFQKGDVVAICAPNQVTRSPFKS